MQNLPTAEVYEREFEYFPWGILIKKVQEYVIKNAPEDGNVLDVFCGPGYLLGQLAKKRKDLTYTGVDLEKEYIEYAKETYPKINFVVGDAMLWESSEQFDVVLCTAGLHHIPYENQNDLILKLASHLKNDGFAVVADPYVSSYSNNEERKLAAAELGYEYLKATIKNGAPDDIVKAAVDILTNDVLGIEFKTFIERTKPIFEEHFTAVEMHKTWPETESQYGDYYLILRK